MMKFIKHPAFIATVTAILSVAAIIGIIRITPEQSTSSAPKEERFWGKADANVVIEYYGDLECPACKVFWNNTESQLKEKYSDKIKFVFKHFPLPIHARADNAAEAAEAAGAQGKFFEYVGILYEKQSPDEVQNWNTDTFVRYAEEAKVPDIDRFRRELRDGYYRGVIKEYREEGKKKGIEATPTVFINGEKIQNPTLDNIEKAIQSRLGTQNNEQK